MVSPCNTDDAMRINTSHVKTAKLHTVLVDYIINSHRLSIQFENYFVKLKKYFLYYIYAPNTSIDIDIKRLSTCYINVYLSASRGQRSKS